MQGVVANSTPAQNVALNTLIAEVPDLERCLEWTWLEIRSRAGNPWFLCAPTPLA